MLNKSNNLNKPHNSVITYILCCVQLIMEYKLKHINNLKIGDEVVIEIPTVCFYTGKVSFINKEQNFIFLDGNTDEDDDDEVGIQFIPNKEGYFKVPNYT